MNKCDFCNYKLPNTKFFKCGHNLKFTYLKEKYECKEAQKKFKKYIANHNDW